MVSRTTILPPSSTTGRLRRDPTASSAACGGLITAVKLSIPYMPRFETVNVPPESSGGVIFPSRTFCASACTVREISPSDFLSASKTVGTTSAPFAATATPTFTREYSSNLPSL